MQEIPIVQGFTSGELTPWLSTRFDLQAYQRGAARISNFQILPYGGIQFRRGTNLVGSAASSDVRLFPFCYSETDILMLEFYPGYMRVYKEGNLLQTSEGTPYLLSTPWHRAEQLASLHFSQVNDALYVCCPTYPPVVLYRYENTRWECEQPDFETMPRETYVQQEGRLTALFEEEGDYAILGIEGGSHRFLKEMEGKECVLADVVTPGRELFCNEAQYTGVNWAPDISVSSVAKGTLLCQQNGHSKMFYYYKCIRDYEPSAFNGSQDLSVYPHYFQAGIMRLDASAQPYEVARDWELRTILTWNAHWEIWRSYNTPEEEPDFHLWNWTCIKTFTQSDHETRQNWAISGSEERPCRIVLVCRCGTDSAVIGAYVQFRILNATREYKFYIDKVIDDKHARARVHRNYTGSSLSFSTQNWSFGAFGAKNGYPAFSTLFQGRLWLGGMPGLPTTLLASVSDDYHNFHMGSNDDAAMHLSILGSDQSRICWICSTRQLLIGTSDSEWSISSGTGTAITPTSVAFRRQSSVGSDAQPARTIENTVLFVQRGGCRMREIAYRLESDGFSATDISMLAEHLFRSGIKEWCVQRGGNFNVWVLMNDDSLAMLTINLDQQVTAWQRVETKGRKVKHVATLQSIRGKDDEVWFVVEMESTGEVLLERMCSDSLHLDCCVTSVSDSDALLPELPHLNGCEIRLIDAETLMPCVSTELQPNHVYHVGIPIEAELRTMPLESGNSFNSVRQFSRFKLRLLDSDTGFDYRSTSNERWEHADFCALPEFGARYTGSIRLPLMPDAAVGQSLCLRYNGCGDFRLLSITQEVDFHGK